MSAKCSHVNVLCCEYGNSLSFDISAIGQTTLCDSLDEMENIENRIKELEKK